MSATGPNQHLLVPIYVDALAVGNDSDEKAFADLTPDFDLLGSQVALGVYCSPQKRPTAGLNRKLEPGIHLHWALPSALTHGEQRQGDRTPTFYRAPNRWLIVRIPGKRGDSKTAAAWVLESDRLRTDEIPSNWYGRVGENGSYRAYVLGARYAYDEWRQRTEPTSPSSEGARAELTAIGPGNPFFAAFYPGCRNVFGVWDPLTGLHEGSFTYLVAGWYSRQEDDPLYVVPARAHESRYESHKRANLEDLKRRWVLKEHAYPNATLCHGAVHAVNWKLSGNRSGIPEGVDDIDIAVGNNGAEALSALIRKRTGRASIVEPLLCAFQYDMLADPRHIPGIVEVDDEVHRRGFTPVEGGSRWVVEPIERSELTGPAAEETLPPFPENHAVGNALGRLTALQDLHDRLTRRLSALRWDYYALWFKSRLDEDGGFDLQRVQSELTAKRTEILNVASSLQTTAADIGTLIEERFATDFAMQVVDANSPTAAGKSDKARFRLVKTDAPRFWLANEPAVLLSGVGVKVSDKHGSDDGDALNCRVLDQVAMDMRFREQNGQLVVDAGGQPLLKGLTALADILVRATQDRLPWTALESLYIETVLVDPASGYDTADLAYRTYRTQPVGDQLVTNLAGSIGQVQDAVRDAQSRDEIVQAYRARGDVPAALPPPFSVRVWRTAWSPLFMVWRIDWQPFTEPPRSAEFEARWSFADRRQRDYRLTAAATGVAPQMQYSGWVPLNPSLSRQFLDRIKGAPPEIATRVGQLLLQPLSGLSSALVTRQEVVQLPPLDDNGRIVGDVLDLIGGHGMSSSPAFPAYRPAQSAKFYPLRNGQIEIRDLWIVDAFGQLQKVVDAGRNNNVILADTLAPRDGGQGSRIPLPPRIMQPARLTFQWLSARFEGDGKPRPSDSDPATSPICGWIVPNHWEESVTVLDVDGRILGKLQRIADASLLEWVSWPPQSLAGAGAAPDAANLGNQDLARFIMALHARGAAALTVLLRIVKEIQLDVTSPVSPGAPGLGFLAAEPLVLAKASLALELAEPPVVDQRVSNPQTVQNWTESVTFPVRLGDQRKRKDGLVGYFAEQNYDSFRPVIETSAGDDGYFDTSSLLELQPFFPDSDAPAAADKRAKVLTLLLDPKAGVFASCPAVPSAFLELSSYISRNTIAEMDVVIDVAPVIGVARELRLPVPDDGSGQWSWGQFEPTVDGKAATWKTNDTIARKDVADGVPAESAEILEGWIALDAHRASVAKPQS